MKSITGLAVLMVFSMSFAGCSDDFTGPTDERVVEVFEKSLAKDYLRISKVEPLSQRTTDDGVAVKAKYKAMFMESYQALRARTRGVEKANLTAMALEHGQWSDLYSFNATGEAHFTKVDDGWMHLWTNEKVD